MKYRKKRRSSEVQTRVAQSCQRFMLWIPSAPSQLVIPQWVWEVEWVGSSAGGRADGRVIRAGQ